MPAPHCRGRYSNQNKIGPEANASTKTMAVLEAITIAIPNGNLIRYTAQGRETRLGVHLHRESQQLKEATHRDREQSNNYF